MWVIDSGTNEHLVVNRSSFIDYKPVKLSANLAGEDSTMSIVGIGTAAFTSLVNGREQVIHLKNAHHIPSADGLFSLGS